MRFPVVSSGTLTEPPKWPVWQPLTFGGVASFARARWGRLLLLQTIVAVAVVITVVLLLNRCWFPVVTQAVLNLSSFGTVRGGQLAWPGKEPVVLAENRFLGLVMDADETGGTGQIADVQLEFTRERIKVVSLLGYTSLPYPRGVTIELNRQTLDPWWNAWRPAFVFGGVFATLLGLFTTWFVLAMLFAVPLRVLAWFASRATSLGKCWRVAAAALLPGAFWMAGALLLYGLEQLSLVGLGVAFGLHFVVDCVYLLGAPFCLPRKTDRGVDPEGNPFIPAPEEKKPSSAAAVPENANPFQSGKSE